MKLAIISYSYTGNNDILAAGVANALSADHIRLVPQKPVSTGSIMLDALLGRTPKVQPGADAMRPYDMVLFVAPVWLGAAAFPLRSCFRALKSNSQRYGFLSISGGADHDNPKLEMDLVKQTGRKPDVLFDQHIRTLLPAEPQPTREMTSAYQLTEDDAQRLTQKAVEKVRETLSAIA